MGQTSNQHRHVITGQTHTQGQTNYHVDSTRQTNSHEEKGTDHR